MGPDVIECEMLVIGSGASGMAAAITAAARLSTGFTPSATIWRASWAATIQARALRSGPR